MRYYSILDLFAFFQFQQEFNYKGIDEILMILNSGKSDNQRIYEIDLILEHSGMDDYMHLAGETTQEETMKSEDEMEKEMENFMKSVNNEVLYTEYADEDFANLFNVNEIKLPTFIFKSNFMNGTMTFFGWCN